MKLAVIGVGNNISALVTIDLIRMAASALRQGRAGHLTEAVPLLKSLPGTSV